MAHKYYLVPENRYSKLQDQLGAVKKIEDKSIEQLQDRLGAVKKIEDKSIDQLPVEVEASEQEKKVNPPPPPGIPESNKRKRIIKTPNDSSWYRQWRKM